MRVSKVTDEHLKEVRQEVLSQGCTPDSFNIQKYLKSEGIELDDSTIRGRFSAMGEPLSGEKEIIRVKKTPIFQVGDIVESITDIYKVTKQGWQGEVLQIHNDTIEIIGPDLASPTVVPMAHFKKIGSKPKPEPKKEIKIEIQTKFDVPIELKDKVPAVELFSNYVERDIDKRLGLALDLGKYPIAQGKQGTGKTYSFMYYSFKRGLPFFLYSMYEDFRLTKLFGDKTIVGGTIKFQESEFIRAIQNPSVILFDEINALSNANTFDFHALLANRELFIKDADDGKGKVYKIHKDCKVGFAQNPKSAKYIGGNIKASNFLGRCVFLTFPEFKESELKKALEKKYPQMSKDDRDNFIKFYIAICQCIDQANIPVDISIRQLNNVIDLWLGGACLKDAIDDGLASILEAVSQPKSKESFIRIAQAVWKDLMPKTMANYLSMMMRRRR
ncbi:MAG: AAA family ATPase [Candidatus Omnitrophota bacterium]|nr:AAA family ATPase [Candidatus Omnitrophota bacterium]